MSLTVVSDSERRVTVVGQLEASSSEGGFGPDEITVDARSMSDIIAQLFGERLNSRGSLGDFRRFGRVRLTIACE